MSRRLGVSVSVRLAADNPNVRLANVRSNAEAIVATLTVPTSVI